MKTKIFHSEKDDFNSLITYSAQIIQQGGLVVFPTETVYGIGANALDPNAASKIYRVKGRPSDNPLIVHIANQQDLNTYAKNITSDAKLLIDAFWPGPLTIVFDKQTVVPSAITGGLDTVAIRMPSNPIAHALIKSANVPICAPSANISGTPSSTIFKHVYNDLFGKVDVIIDGGQSAVGLESTVLDMTGDIPVVLRPGAITKSMIETIIKHSVIDTTEHITDNTIPKAPGMKYKHYAPKGEVILLKGTQDDIINYIKQQDPSIGIIASNELCQYLETYHTYPLGPKNDPSLIARNIFLALRTMDEHNIKHIYVEAFEDKELGQAIMNRLLKASNYNLIKL
ncbi:MAG: L-threonylcarbamoyladenylate synthase [Candidatus Izemoplasma sp.]|nr:L-threonylcarbamoyladenylate synthase [Candidatus Izemoplasma sp.]